MCAGTVVKETSPPGLSDSTQDTVKTKSNVQDEMTAQYGHGIAQSYFDNNSQNIESAQPEQYPAYEYNQTYNAFRLQWQFGRYMQSVQEYFHPMAHPSQDYYGQDGQYIHVQHAEHQISSHDDKTFPIPVISQHRDTIITSHAQPPEQPICGHDEQTFPIPVISQRRDSILASHDQPPEQQICGHDDNTSMGKNQSFCDLSNTDGYGENLSDCDVDIESSGGEYLQVTDPFDQQNVTGSKPSMDTGNVKNLGTPGKNENTLKRKNPTISSNYELRSKKKSKIEDL